MQLQTLKQSVSLTSEGPINMARTNRAQMPQRRQRWARGRQQGCWLSRDASCLNPRAKLVSAWFVLFCAYPEPFQSPREPSPNPSHELCCLVHSGAAQILGARSEEICASPWHTCHHRPRWGVISCESASAQCPTWKGIFTNCGS